MNQIIDIIHFHSFMDKPEAWGRAEGRKIFQALVDFVESHAGVTVFQISMRGVRRMDMSCSSETVVELARRYRGTKGFWLAELTDTDLIENIEVAAEKKKQPLMLWTGGQVRVIGVQASHGTRDALAFVLDRPQTRASEFVENASNISIANASTKFKQLWEQGFIMREGSAADSGGVEFVYRRIGG